MTGTPDPGTLADHGFSPRSAAVLQLRTFRVICQPQDVEDDSFRWQISPVEVQRLSNAAPPAYGLIGDLAVEAGEWFVGATTSIVFAVPAEGVHDSTTPGDLAAVVDDYGPWAAQILWDHTVAAARTVAALCPESMDHIDLPRRMPGVAYSPPSDDAPEQVGGTTSRA